MSSYTVLSGVTKTLAKFLHTATGVPVDHNKSPADTIPDSQTLIHLYLYRVETSPFFQNADWLRPSRSTRQQPPLGVNLFYLITPYGSGQLEIQKTLGEVMKVFHETPVIPPSSFDPALADTTEELRVVFRALPMEEMRELWRAFESRSYRLSVTYEVSVALIDSAVTQPVVPVEERHVTVEQLS